MATQRLVLIHPHEAEIIKEKDLIISQEEDLVVSQDQAYQEQEE